MPTSPWRTLAKFAEPIAWWRADLYGPEDGSAEQLLDGTLGGGWGPIEAWVPFFYEHDVINGRPGFIISEALDAYIDVYEFVDFDEPHPDRDKPFVTDAVSFAAIMSKNTGWMMLFFLSQKEANSYSWGVYTIFEESNGLHSIEVSSVNGHYYEFSFKLNDIDLGELPDVIALTINLDIDGIRVWVNDTLMGEAPSSDSSVFVTGPIETYYLDDPPHPSDPIPVYHHNTINHYWTTPEKFHVFEYIVFDHVVDHQDVWDYARCWYLNDCDDIIPPLRLKRRDDHNKYGSPRLRTPLVIQGSSKQSRQRIATPNTYW